MFFAESVKIALSNLLLHKLRTSLTMLGMIFGWPPSCRCSPSGPEPDGKLCR